MAGNSKNPLVTVFLRGLAVLLPVAATLFVLAWLWGVLRKYVFGHLEDVVQWLWQLLPGVEQPLPQLLATGFAIICTLAVILLAGWWLASFLGRQLFAALDRLLRRVPLVGAIYPNVKQFTEFFFTEDRKISFERVVAVEYPRRGLYSIGFLTKTSLRSLNAHTGKESVSVFVPSSPMPMTGYTLFVALDELVPINLSVDEAFRFVIAGGVLVPGSDQDDAVSRRADAQTARPVLSIPPPPGA